MKKIVRKQAVTKQTICEIDKIVRKRAITEQTICEID